MDCDAKYLVQGLASPLLNHIGLLIFTAMQSPSYYRE